MSQPGGTAGLTSGPTERRTSVGIELGEAARPTLVRWSNWADRWGSQERASYALLTEDGPVLIDPELPARAAAALVAALVGHRPTATVLTSDRHERDAYAIRGRWGTPVWAPAAGLPERGGALAGQPDHAFEDGAVLPGGLRAIVLDGGWGGGAGDAALAWVAPGGARVLFTGDALNGRCTPDQPNPYHLRRAPALYAGVRHSWLAGLRPERLRYGLRRLLDEDAQLICGAHGLPYGDAPQAALVELLAQDWPALLASGHLPAAAVRCASPDGQPAPRWQVPERHGRSHTH